MRNYSLSKSEKQEFYEKMVEIEQFCKDNNIAHSVSMDSYYFTLDGKNYRVSNHTIKSSNARAFDEGGNQIRRLYHENEKDIIYITAGKTRIIDIYNDLKNGYELDKRGNRK